MKRIILSLSCIAMMATSFAQDCSKIFISEYVEGIGNNKAIEIYNPTDAAINMSEYYLQRYSNGSLTASAQNATAEAKTIQLVGTVGPKQTIVYVVDLRNPNGSGQTAPVWSELQAKANHFLNPTYTINNVMYFNGNDALLLAKGNANSPLGTNDVLCDIFGKIGENPENIVKGTLGWSTVAPYNMTSNNPLDKEVTADHSMIRKPGIKKGQTPVPINSILTFNPLLEWDTIPAVLPRLDQFGQPQFNQAGNLIVDGNWSTLGWHACECDPASVGVEALDLDNIKIYPNPTSGNFTISGLENVAKIEVYNSLGQEITTISNNTQSTVSFDLSEKTGIYMVTITNISGRSATQKVIVK